MMAPCLNYTMMTNLFVMNLLVICVVRAMSHFLTFVKLRSALSLWLGSSSIPGRPLFQHVSTTGCSSRQVMAPLSQGFILPGHYHWLLGQS